MARHSTYPINWIRSNENPTNERFKSRKLLHTRKTKNPYETYTKIAEINEKQHLRTLDKARAKNNNRFTGRYDVYWIWYYSLCCFQPLFHVRPINIAFNKRWNFLSAYTQPTQQYKWLHIRWTWIECDPRKRPRWTNEISMRRERSEGVYRMKDTMPYDTVGRN